MVDAWASAQFPGGHGRCPVRAAAEHLGQHLRILQRGGGALCPDRTGGVGGVADQDNWARCQVSIRISSTGEW